MSTSIFLFLSNGHICTAFYIWSNRNHILSEETPRCFLRYKFCCLYTPVTRRITITTHTVLLSQNWQRCCRVIQRFIVAANKVFYWRRMRSQRRWKISGRKICQCRSVVYSKNNNNNNRTGKPCSILAVRNENYSRLLILWKKKKRYCVALQVMSAKKITKSILFYPRQLSLKKCSSA